MAITLTVIQGPHVGLSFTFTEHATFLVGRSPDAHFRIPEDDRHFSRMHFLVEANPPLCRLVDLRSTGGTYVNGVRVQTADLKDGDRIGAGKTVLRVAIGSTEPEHTAAPVAPPEGDELTELVAQAGQMTGTDLLELVRADQRQRWRKGAGLAVEVYLERLPGLRDRAELVVDLVCQEVWLREERGEAAIPEDYLRRLPQYAADLRREFAQRAGRPSQPSSGVAVDLSSDEPDRQPPRGLPPRPEIPGYAIERELGRGGMGVVYLAHRQADGVRVAVKTVLPAVRASEAATGRFLREARLLQKLSHPHIVAFWEMGTADGQLFFVMDYVEGMNAAQLLRANGPLSVSRAVRLVSQLLEALAYAHGQGVVHRDVKPSNLLVTRLLGQEAAKLADFGLAKAYQNSPLSGLTLTGALGGTAAYMAPEQALDFRAAPPAADQYAAAATLYELLTGRPLYDGEQGATDILMKKLLEEPVPIRQRRPELPETLARVIHQALARKPEQRFADVTVFRLALTPFQDDRAENG